jgi:hypothetical protein
MSTKKRARRAEPWRKPKPKKVAKRGTKHLSPAQKAHAKARARRAGRPYPNMVDNMSEAASSTGSGKRATKKRGATKKRTAGATKRGATKKTAAKKSATKRGATKKTAAKKSATRRGAAKKAAAKKAAGRKTTRSGAAKKSASKRGAGRKKATRRATKTQREHDPRGGLTAAGRRAFHDRDGSNLKPGVKKKASEMSVSDMRRKGSWASRFYGRKGKLPPLVDENGEPTRFALTAAAWGEPVPKTEAAARKIAAKGHRLLERAARAS